MLWIDFETYNSVKDIKAGAYEYTRTCEILLCSYAIDDGPVKIWDRAVGDFLPPDLWAALKNPKMQLTAHNAMFDRNVIRYALDLETDLTRWRCTMVQAYLHALPGALDALGKAMGLGGDYSKLKEGKSLINRFCKPAPKNHKAERYDHISHPEEWAQFRAYAAQDIVAMRECAKRMPDVNLKGEGLATYHLDQKINDRGFQVDTDLVEAGARAAVTEKATLTERFEAITSAEVRPTQRRKFCEYLNENYDLGLDNTRAATFLEMIADKPDLNPQAKELMQIAMLSNKTSTAKYKTLLPAVSPDGRFRGGLQYSGASRTRRWAGRTFQPHNLPSRGLPPEESIATYIDALKTGCHDFLFDDLMLYGSAALRGVLIAPKGKKLVISDLSNIEGRLNAWLAGEKWKIEAFEAFDRGEGPDLYNVTAGSLIGKNPNEVTKSERNAMGKVPELALGYGGGFGAFQTFSKAYNIKMADLWPTIQRNLKQQFIQGAKNNWYNWGEDRVKEEHPDTSIIETEWIASEAVKLAWRGRHPAISALWNACEKAARAAIMQPGKTFTAGAFLKFSVREFSGKRYLLMRLPTGNFLIYSSPQISESSGSLVYMGINSLATGGAFGQWTRLHTYGGKLVENACQSLSRDILAAGMHAAEAAGYKIVLTVHDELVTEVPDTENFNADALSVILARPVKGCDGVPLAAAGFETYRYRKD